MKCFIVCVLFLQRSKGPPEESLSACVRRDSRTGSVGAVVLSESQSFKHSLSDRYQEGPTNTEI